MTVRELLAALQGLDPSLPIVLSGDSSILGNGDECWCGPAARAPGLASMTEDGGEDSANGGPPCVVLWPECSWSELIDAAVSGDEERGA